MELYIVASRVKQTLEREYGMEAKRVFVGNFMTAIDMPGFSISLLPLRDHVEWLGYLDQRCSAPAWPQVSPERVLPKSVQVPLVQPPEGESLSPDDTLYQCIKLCCQLIIEKANYLTELDRNAGDGDMGISLERGARAVLQELPSFAYPHSTAIRQLALCIQHHTGGRLIPQDESFPNSLVCRN